MEDDRVSTPTLWRIPAAAVRLTRVRAAGGGPARGRAPEAKGEEEELGGIRGRRRPAIRDGDARPLTRPPTAVCVFV